MIVTGDDNDNAITTGSGNDIIDGGAGDDVIYGDLGNDTLNGGSGADIFVYGRVGLGIDVIEDFEVGIDKIYVSSSIFDTILFDVGLVKDE